MRLLKWLSARKEIGKTICAETIFYKKRLIYIYCNIGEMRYSSLFEEYRTVMFEISWWVDSKRVKSSSSLDNLPYTIERSIKQAKSYIDRLCQIPSDVENAKQFFKETISKIQ